MGSKAPHAAPALAVRVQCDLHEMAGGLLLMTFAAPNVHPMSKHGREVCNPAVKSNIPIIKCGSKRTALRTKQEIGDLPNQSSSSSS